MCLSIATLVGVRVEKLKVIGFMLENLDLQASGCITVVKELRNSSYNLISLPNTIICIKQDKSIASESQTDGKLLETVDVPGIPIVM